VAETESEIDAVTESVEEGASVEVAEVEAVSVEVDV
jgi:hypothetical protein